MVKKIIFVVIALLGTVITYFLSLWVILSNAKIEVYRQSLLTSNETQEYRSFLEINTEYHKLAETMPTKVTIKLYQTVAFANDNYAYQYFIFIAGVDENVIISASEEHSAKVPQMKVIQTKADDELLAEPKLIYDSNLDETIMQNTTGSAQIFIDNYRELKGFFFSTPLIKDNGEYKVELYANTGTLFDEFSFVHNEEYATEAITKEQFTEKFDAKEEYVKALDYEVFNEYVNKEAKIINLWITLLIYFAVVVLLWFIFFFRKRYNFKH